MRKRQTPEEIFLDQVNIMIKNMIIDNPNYLSGYYHEKPLGLHDMIMDTRGRGEFMLAEIEKMKHLIIYDEQG